IIVDAAPPWGAAKTYLRVTTPPVPQAWWQYHDTAGLRRCRVRQSRWDCPSLFAREWTWSMATRPTTAHYIVLPLPDHRLAQKPARHDRTDCIHESTYFLQCPALEHRPAGTC